MDLTIGLLTALKEIRDSFPDELKSRIENCKKMRHNPEVK